MQAIRPELGVWSTYYVDLSPEDAVREFKKNGIYASELSDEHGYVLLSRGEPEKVGAEFKKFLDGEGFNMTQGHLYLQVKLVRDPNAVDELVKWMRLYSAIGIKNAVLHADKISKSISVEDRLNQNIERLTELYERTKDLPIRVCMENVSGAPDIEGLLTLIQNFPEDKFGICLDTGHLNFSEAPDQMAFIEKAGSRLHALHIADNEGKEDQHMIPYGKGTVNFEDVVRGIRKVGYDGIFSLEIPGERHAPMCVLAAKLRYIRAIYDYLMSID